MPGWSAPKDWNARIRAGVLHYKKNLSASGAQWRLMRRYERATY